MTESDRITLRLGPLLDPLRSAAATAGRTMSEEARVRLAESLGVAAPVLLPGDVANLGRYAKKKRAKKSPTRTARN